MCVDCGVAVQPKPFKFVARRPRMRCATCQRSHRRRAQLLAYVASAARVADELDMPDVGLDFRLIGARLRTVLNRPARG